MAKRTSNRNAGELIASRTPFKGNNFEGFAGAPRSHGWLSGTQFSKQIEGLKNIDYTVNDPRSDTPIAVHHEGGWHYPDVSHSPTTGKHQSIVRGALGIKNAKELKREAAAKKKADKQSAQEKDLWNS